MAYRRLTWRPKDLHPWDWRALPKEPLADGDVVPQDFADAVRAADRELDRLVLEDV